MLYDHNDPAFLMRYARGLIDLAKKAACERERGTFLGEASHVITAAERLVKAGKPVVIVMEVA